MTSPVADISLGTIGQIAVPVTNLERSVAFYRDLLGMKLLFQVPNLAFFDCGGVRLMLDLPQDKSEHRSSIIYFKVPHIEEAFQALSSRGVEFHDKPHLVAKMPDHELWMAFFRDPDLNLHALMCEVHN